MVGDSPRVEPGLYHNPLKNACQVIEGFHVLKEEKTPEWDCIVLSVSDKWKLKWTASGNENLQGFVIMKCEVFVA